MMMNMPFFCLFATAFLAATTAQESSTQTVTFANIHTEQTTGCLVGVDGLDRLVTSILSNAACTMDASSTSCSITVPVNHNTMSSTTFEYAWTTGCTGLVLGEPLVLALPEEWNVLDLSVPAAGQGEMDGSEIVERQLEGEDAEPKEIGILLLLIAGLFGGVSLIAFVGGLC